MMVIIGKKIYKGQGEAMGGRSGQLSNLQSYLKYFVIGIILLVVGMTFSVARGAEVGEMMLLRVKPAVVFIFSSIQGAVQINTKNGPRVFKDVGMASSGSGFIINPNGYICTNGHVVQYYYEKNDEQLERLFLMQVIQRHFIPKLIQSGKISNNPVRIRKAVIELYGLLKPKTQVQIKKNLFVFLSNKKRYPAEVKDYSPPIGPYPGKIDIPGFQYESETGKDIAIIKIEAKDLPIVKLGDSSAVQLGESVYAAGYPGVVLAHAMLQKSLENLLDCTVTVGHISGKKLTATGASLIQTDTPIAHGNSGGPAFDAKGEVIGMSTLASIEKSPTGTIQQIQGFNFLVPINTVKEFIARAGIQIGKESLFNKLWTKALMAYQKQDCDGVMKYCDAVLRLMPGQPDVVKLQRLTQEKITRGECPVSWKKIVLYVGIGVGILIILILIILFMRKGNRRAVPVTGGTPPAGSLSGGVTRVQEPPAASLGMLIGKEGPLEGRTFEVSKEGLKIGRDSSRCDIVIDNPHVSREHAWVGEENGKIVVKDLTSANGTFLNSLSHQVTSEALAPGDIIIIGKGKMASFLFKRP